MTDNEIIKALEEVIGMRTLAKKSPKIDTSLLIAILDLINRQQAEIEELQKRIINWRKDMDYRPNEIKSEAIKKFTERLNYKIVNTSSVFTVQKATHEFLSGNAHRQQEILDYIGELVNEMTE